MIDAQRSADAPVPRGPAAALPSAASRAVLDGGRAPWSWSISDGVLAALAYADVFDWPLSADEIHRKLPASASLDEVHSALQLPKVTAVVDATEGLYALWGRDSLIAERRRREAISTDLWKRAARYGRVIAGLPFVKMVAVSGSLAVNAADEHADVDYFVVTEDDRVWTARALIIGVVKVARIGRHRRATLCPNYLIGESNLRLTDRDRFTAHELLQLVPLFGTDTYDRLLAENQWFREFLPNGVGNRAAPLPEPPAVGRRLRPLLANRAVDRAVDRLERWERERKIPRLTGEGSTAETRFDENVCKGHVDGHRQRILDAYESRLQRLAVGR